MEAAQWSVLRSGHGGQRARNSHRGYGHPSGLLLRVQSRDLQTVDLVHLAHDLQEQQVFRLWATK